MSTEPIGYVSLIVLARFGDLRQAGPLPQGEEALHEAIAEAYIPLLTTLSEFAEAGLPLRMALAVSPILLEQLADPVVQKHVVLSLEAALQRAEDDVVRWEAIGEPHLVYLARFYVDWYERALRAFNDRFSRNLVAVLHALIDQRAVEVFTQPATHAYLPPLADGALVRTQSEMGMATTMWHLGQATGFWLPELCYRPGLRQQLTDLGIRLVVLEGPPPDKEFGALRPVWFGTASKLTALLRDRPSVLQVLSSSVGYPGDFLYREFYRRDPLSGLHYWRVTGTGVALDQKTMYDPYHAMARAHEHARHYVRLIEERLHGFAATSTVPGLLVVAFDAELFGHGWFEGATWLRLVFQQLVTHPSIALTTPSAYLERYPPEDIITPEIRYSSWDSPALDAHWERINSAAKKMRLAAEECHDADGEHERCLNQAARELLLASASDWAALIATGRAPDYAYQRFNSHLTRFDQLLDLARVPALDRQQELLLSQLEELDNPFPLLNYRIFADDAE